MKEKLILVGIALAGSLLGIAAAAYVHTKNGGVLSAKPDRENPPVSAPPKAGPRSTTHTATPSSTQTTTQPQYS